MPEEYEKEQFIKLNDFSTGMQVTSTRFQKRSSDLDLAQNATLDEIGGVGKKKGYSQRGSDLTSTSTSTTTSTSTSTSTTTTA